MIPSPEIVFAGLALVTNALAVLAGVGYHAGRITKTQEQLASIVADHERRLRAIERPTFFTETAASTRP